MTLASALALLLIVGECPDLPTCRNELAATRTKAERAILFWRTEAKTTDRALAGCQQKLSTRTPTVAVTLLPPPSVDSACQSSISLPWLVVLGAGAAVMGYAVGAQACGQSLPIIVR